MCGIAGFWSADRINHDEGVRLGLSMANAMHQRGPDNQNVWVNEDAGLVFAHARLSIIDLSDAANQPFLSTDGRVAIVYNGEVYNFRTLRKELEQAGIVFRTASDTEVVLHACRHWGIFEAARRLVGMFAFAYWDSDVRKLFLVRDPLGIKPLYFGRAGNIFLFSSTLAAIRQHPGFRRSVSPDALAAYFRFSYVPAPLSIYSGIFKLLPGHILTITESGGQTQECYWDALTKVRQALAETFDASDREIADAFEHLLRDSVRGCLISDVPIGAFLSGGIDSSLVTAIMQVEGGRRTQTFTVGFSDARFDESKFAREVAAHLDCKHTEITCTTADAKALITDIPACYDEPFADSSQIPTMLLCKLTRQSVTVALSGDGGDELFGGYDRYYWMERLQRAQARPKLFNSILSSLARTFPREVIFPLLWKLPTSKAGKIVSKVDQWYHLSRILEHCGDYSYLYRTAPMTVCAYRDCPLLIRETEPDSILDDGFVRAAIPDLIQWMQFVDQQTYLPDDILAKVDRASMAYSLEARVPFLDHRVVEFAWRVPTRLKVMNGRGKILMRNLLSRYIPVSLIERPKRGFSIPLSDWLKGDLRDWGESLVKSATYTSDLLLDLTGIETTWRNFLTGRAEHTLTTVWNLLTYLSWYERYGQ